MTFRVELAPAAQRNIRRISSRYREPIENAIYRLGDDPYPHGSIKLRGEENTWRVRVGRFRIIYEVQADLLLVLILRVAPRNEATYRR